MTTLSNDISYHIQETPNGWLLVMQNAHCTISQMFQSPASARRGIANSATALTSLTFQHLSRPGR